MLISFYVFYFYFYIFNFNVTEKLNLKMYIYCTRNKFMYVEKKKCRERETYIIYMFKHAFYIVYEQNGYNFLIVPEIYTLFFYRGNYNFHAIFYYFYCNFPIFMMFFMFLGLHGAPHFYAIWKK